MPKAKEKKGKSLSKLSFLLNVILIFHIWTIIQLEFFTFSSFTKLERNVVPFGNYFRGNNNFWLFHKNYCIFNDQWRTTELNGNVDPERQQDSFMSLNFTLKVMHMIKFDHSTPVWSIADCKYLNCKQLSFRTTFTAPLPCILQYVRHWGD